MILQVYIYININFELLNIVITLGISGVGKTSLMET